MRINWQAFIAVDPEIHHCEPCIKGTRIPVSMIVGSVADGMSFDEVIDSYQQLKRESVQAALAYAADIVHHEVFLPQPLLHVLRQAGRRAADQFEDLVGEIFLHGASDV
ncbi:MAG: DUF433 domain-containing protein [Anaerolineales bacterium]|nr:DUF433 domain-containing protein [Anaerolineales bacterium]